LFHGRFESFCAYGIHRKEGECLREGYTIRPGVQKFNVYIHFPKNCTQSHFTECAFRNRPLHKQSRSSGQREAMNDTNEPLVTNCEDCFLLVRDADSRWSVFAGLVDLSGHLSAGLQTGPKASMLPQCFNAKMLSLLP
jgi:hypothetical protein